MPNFKPFQSVTGKNSATLFEIRLENDVIVLRGAEADASSQMLRGVVVLCLPQPLKVVDVHLRMTGQCKVGWNDQRLTPTGISTNRVDKTTEIFNHKWPPFVGAEGSGSNSKGMMLPAGNYEWPFEVIIPGSMIESVEGLTHSHVMYKLKATVARGKFAYDLHTYKPVRIVRTLDPSALELSHAMTVENIWPNKIEYSLIIPQKAIVFGTSIGIEAKFTSLLKGLKIGAIKCQLVEIQDFNIPGPSYTEKSFKNQREIGKWEFEVNEDNYHDMLDESGQDGFVLKETLPLPKSLRHCLQDLETQGIKIRHKVKFNIALLNPDGHTSELRATLPVTIFISPNMPLDEAGNLLDQTPNSTESFDVDSHAPPLYGQHILDQLFADMDPLPTGFMTPAPGSGMNTPYHNRSRSGSNENISSMDDVAGTAIRPDALSSRLQNLNSSSRNSSFLRRGGGSNSGGNTPAGHFAEDSGLHHGHSSTRSIRSLTHTQSEYFDQNGSAPRSNALSRRTSEEEHYNGNSGMTSGVHTPEHLDSTDLAELNKVPSYTTAVRAPVRSMSYREAEALPDYDTAISAPPSPEMAVSQMAMRAPGASILPTTPGLEMGNGGSSRFRTGMGIGSLTAAERNNIDSDAARRLHLIQARGRAH